MSKCIPCAVLMALILVLGAAWLLEVRSRQSHDQQTDGRLTAIEQTMTAYARLLAAGQSQPSDVDVRAAFAERVKGKMESTGDAINRAADMSSDAELKREKARDRAHLEGRFAADGSDPRWAQITEIAANRAIADPALASFDAPAHSDMHCASTMCRMTFSFDSAAAASDWAMFYPLGVTIQLPVTQSLHTRLPDGRVELVMYGFRDPEAKPLR